MRLSGRFLAIMMPTRLSIPFALTRFPRLGSAQQTARAPSAVQDSLPALPVDLREWQTIQERELVTAALSQANYHQRKAAQLLGLSYHQLRGLLRKYDVGQDN